MQRKIRYILIILVIIISVLIDIKILRMVYQEMKEDEKITLYYEEADIDIENEFIGVIDIESIDLHEGFYHPLSTNNRLKNGIKVIKEDMNRLLILASHSGRSNVAKFNLLNRLEKGDVIEISYNNKDYIYEYDHFYRVQKTGHVYIDYNNQRNALILITCDLKDDSKQEVHIAYMI